MEVITQALLVRCASIPQHQAGNYWWGQQHPQPKWGRRSIRCHGNTPTSAPPAGPLPVAAVTTWHQSPFSHPASPRPTALLRHPPVLWPRAQGRHCHQRCAAGNFTRSWRESTGFSQTEEAVEVLFVFFGHIYAGGRYRGKSWGQYNACMSLSVAHGLRPILCPTVKVTGT